MKANITKDMIDAISKKQIEVLKKWWEANATLPMKMQAEGKTMKGALAFIRSVARTVAQDGMAMISDEDTYGLLVHYMADEQEGATYGGSDETTKKKKKQPAHVETEAEKLEKMTDEERKAYIERKNAEEKARKAAEEERNRKIAERTAKEAAKTAKAAALKKAAEAQLLFNF